MIGNTIAVGIKRWFHSIVIITNGVIIIIVIQICRDAVVISISFGIDTGIFHNIRDTVIIIININIIGNTVIIVVIYQVTTIQIIRYTIQIGINGIFGFIVTVRVGTLVNCQNTVVIIIHIEIIGNAVTVGIVVLRIAILRIVII